MIVRGLVTVHKRLEVRSEKPYGCSPHGVTEDTKASQPFLPHKLFINRASAEVHQLQKLGEPCSEVIRLVARMSRSRKALKESNVLLEPHSETIKIVELGQNQLFGLSDITDSKRQFTVTVASPSLIYLELNLDTMHPAWRWFLRSTEFLEFYEHHRNTVSDLLKNAKELRRKREDCIL
jgi:hypothetical protein